MWNSFAFPVLQIGRWNGTDCVFWAAGGQAELPAGWKKERAPGGGELLHALPAGKRRRTGVLAGSRRLAGEPEI